MQVLIAFNPVSGRGRSAQLAEELASTLTDAGYETQQVPTPATVDAGWLASKETGDTVAAIAVGGDGTMRMVAAELAGGDVPVYHAACGTENLFATSMGLSPDPARVLAAIEAGNVQRIDTASAGGAFMLLMCSVGIDAAIVADLDARRGASITHWTYAMPIARQLLQFRHPTLSVIVDGEHIVDGCRGWVVVANSPAYARGLNPARDASLTDGLLDVLFLPVGGLLQSLAWVQRMMRGVQLRHPAAVHARGTAVTIESDPASPWQLDGDPAPDGAATTALDVSVSPASLPILLPSG